MKRVVDGELYNTETARLVGTYDNGCGAGEFDYVYEELYLKNTGEFFLYGSGGARTEYAVDDGNGGWCGVDAIIPLSLTQAKQWGEEHLNVDTYIEFFVAEA